MSGRAQLPQMSSEAPCEVAGDSPRVSEDSPARRRPARTSSHAAAAAVITLLAPPPKPSEASFDADSAQVMVQKDLGSAGAEGADNRPSVPAPLPRRPQAGSSHSGAVIYSQVLFDCQE